MKLYEIQIPVRPNTVNSFKLGREITGVGHYFPVFTEKHNERFFEYVLGLCGGFSVLPEIEGTWADESGTLYREKMIPVRFATDGYFADDNVKLIAEFAKKHYDQKAIFVAELGEVRFF